MIKVFLRRDPVGYNIDIIIAEWSGEELTHIGRIEDGNITMQPHKKGSVVDATIRMDGRKGDELLKAFMDASSEFGIEPDSVAHIRGNLEATKYHLEDMRTLLKLKGGRRA